MPCEVSIHLRLECVSFLHTRKSIAPDSIVKHSTYKFYILARLNLRVCLQHFHTSTLRHDSVQAPSTSPLVPSLSRDLHKRIIFNDFDLLSVHPEPFDKPAVRPELSRRRRLVCSGQARRRVSGRIPRIQQKSRKFSVRFTLPVRPFSFLAS